MNMPLVIFQINGMESGPYFHENYAGHIGPECARTQVLVSHSNVCASLHRERVPRIAIIFGVLGIPYLR